MAHHETYGPPPDPLKELERQLAEMTNERNTWRELAQKTEAKLRELHSQ